MVNILSHVDKSLRSAGEKPKREVFRWASDSNPGVFTMIPKNTLNIDGRYQREEVSREKVLSIARDWDWLIFGTLSVIRRMDGSLWVFDGGHRTRASFYRDDIVELPCMVHDVGSLTDEAKAFVARNTMVSNVSAFARFRASACAEEPIAIQAKEILDRHGLTVVKSSSQPDTMSAIGSLVDCIKQNAKLAEQALEFCCRINRDTGPSSMVLIGIFTLQQHFLPQGIDMLAEHGEKILTHSQKEIEIRIRQMRAETGKGGSAVYAKAILDLINKGKRNRIQW